MMVLNERWLVSLTETGKAGEEGVCGERRSSILDI